MKQYGISNIGEGSMVKLPQFKWSDDIYKYDARWHTRTPGVPAEQGNIWAVERITHGTATDIQNRLLEDGHWSAS